jgi:hypothetical protein
MHNRFMQDGGAVRMGNLASNLLRLCKWTQMRHKDDAIIDLMREIAWFMEWNGDLALPELPNMQREVCRWRRVWPLEPARSILSLRARQMSDRILELSGLMNQDKGNRSS